MLAANQSEEQQAALIEALQTENRQLKQVEELQQGVEQQLREQVQLLLEQVAHLNRYLFGRKSERLDPGQLDLFRSGELPEACASFEGESLTKNHQKKNTGGHGRGSLPAHLERVIHNLDVPEGERTCSVCDEAMGKIGEEITERAHFVPATFLVNRFVRTKYACPRGHGVKTAALPDGVVEGSKYDASVHAHVVVAKYNDHLPLNRLEGIFKRHGIKLARQTMWDMLVRVDELVAQPILRQMREELLTEPILHADETSVVLRVEGQRESKSGWVWGWRNEPHCRSKSPPKVLIEFREGRGGNVPTSFLGEWTGTLITDGFQGYNPVAEKNSILRAGCWAHARRPFREMLEKHPKWAGLPLLLINRLFALERATRNRAERLKLDEDEALRLCKTVRARTATRRVERLMSLLFELDAVPAILPKSKLGKGIKYVLNQAARLRVFLNDPRVPMHNNDSERDLRHIIIGRKNWMIFASPRGGQVACRLYSLMLSCRQNNVDPEAYLEDVIMAVATTPSSEIASLTPWAWGQAHPPETETH